VVCDCSFFGGEIYHCRALRGSDYNYHLIVNSYLIKTFKLKKMLFFLTKI